MPPVPGQRQMVCRKKGPQGDVLDEDAQHEVDKEEYFGLWVLAGFASVLMLLFFLWPIMRAVRKCVCPTQEEREENRVKDFQEGTETPRDSIPTAVPPRRSRTCASS